MEEGKQGSQVKREKLNKPDKLEKLQKLQKSGQPDKKGLSVWQLTMLALGTVVGGSFFLGSSVAIRAAGPSVLLAYVIGGVLVYLILSALSEMTVANPAPGSFRTYTEQAFGRGAGFTVGWVYWTGLVLAMSSEATAVSILLRSWFPALPLALAGAGIIVLVTLLNLLGAERLGKLESGLAAFKLLAIVAFIVIAVAIVAALCDYHESSHHCLKKYDSLALIIEENIKLQLEQLLQRLLSGIDSTADSRTLQTAATLLSWSIYGVTFRWNKEGRHESAAALAGRLVPLMNNGVSLLTPAGGE